MIPTVLEGQSALIKWYPETINAIKITGFDNLVNNGVVHVIDDVLMPDGIFPTIASVASSDERFTTLVTAATKADLVNALAGTDPLTLFAPTNDAFDLVDNSTLAKLLTVPWKAHLVDLLQYHILAGETRAADLSDNMTATTLNEEHFTITLNPDEITTSSGDTSAIGETDIYAVNGVIHVIDKVLLPPSAKFNIAEFASNNLAFSTLVELVKLAGLVEILEGAGPFTLFAPTNDAFAALPTKYIDWIKAPENKSSLVDVLKYHLFPKISLKPLAPGMIPTVLEGESALIKWYPETINAIKITGFDNLVNNGVVHVIDDVLIPDGILPTIAIVASFDDRFTTLVTAATKADLVNALAGTDPLTLFAPTNDAFDLVDNSTLAKLLTAPWKAHLVDLLQYHILAGETRAADLSDNMA